MPGHDNTGQITSKRQKTLDTWFKPGTRDSLLAYHQRTDDEWASKREEIEQIEKQVSDTAKKLKTSLAADCKRKQRARQVIDDIKSGKRDEEGNIIKLKVAKVRLLSLINQSTLLLFHSLFALSPNPVYLILA